MASDVLTGTQFGSITDNSPYQRHLQYIGTYTYAQDAINNKTTLTLRGYLYIYNSAYATYASDYSTFKINDTTISTASYHYETPDDSGYHYIGYTTKTVTHNADGTFPTTSIPMYASSFHFGGQSATFEIRNLPKLDRVAPTVTSSLASRTASSLTISVTASANCDVWEYKIGDGAWTQFSTTDATAVTCTLTGLSPSVTYSVQFRVRKTVNHLTGTSTAVSYTTLGAAIINSATEIFADATTVKVSVSAEIYNASYTYSLAIKNGSTTILTLTFPAQSVGTRTLSATLTSAQRTTLLNGMANVASFSATYELTSLNNGNVIGTSTTTALIKTSEASSAPGAPTFTYKDTKTATVNVTGNNQTLIQGQSTLGLQSLTATAKNGATIASYTITIGGTTKTTTSGGTVSVGTVSQSGQLSLTVTAKDTRGYTSSTSQTITCYAYKLPSLESGVVFRDVVESTQVTLTFSGTYSAIGSNAVTSKYKYKKTSESTYSAEVSKTVTYASGLFSFSQAHIEDFDADSSYDFALTISDSLNTESYAFVVPPYEPLVAYRETGLGVKKIPDPSYALDINGATNVGSTLSVTGNSTMSGTLTMGGMITAVGSQNSDSYSTGGLNMNNSDIIRLNSIYTADTAANAKEGIHFYRTSTTVDSVHANAGALYFTPNRTLGQAGTSQTVLHSGNTTYITDSGTSGNWTYRKWSDGTAECWGTFDCNITGWQSWGNLYESVRSPGLAPAYPTDLFSDTPILSVNVWASNIGTCGVELFGTHNKTTAPSIIPLRPSSGGTGVVSVYIHARGVWS